MENIRPKRIRAIFYCLFSVLCLLGSTTAIFAAEHYRLTPLFELKVGEKIDDFFLTFIPAPFGYQEGRKTPLGPGGTKVLVDNSGNFYLLKRHDAIIKMNSKGEVINQIKGPDAFSRPFEMKLDGLDNLHVLFRNKTHIASEYRYAVAKFNKYGDFLHLIGEKEKFECIFMQVSINGTVFLRRCDQGANPEQFLRYDKDGGFAGVVEHKDITDIPDGEGGYLVITDQLEEGVDGNLYVINNSDLDVKKYTDYGKGSRKIAEAKPVAEKKVFPWLEKGKAPFQGFDLGSKMYFGYSTKWKRIELPKYLLEVSSFVDTLSYYTYNLENDNYDTLTCKSSVEKEGKFLYRTLLRNYNGDFYELIIFFNDPPRVTPQDHVKFYKWEKIK